jgi:glycosyltransferase involved in cell wall biosynthesis
LKICRLVWSYPDPSKISYGLGPNFYHISEEQAKLGVEVHIISLNSDGNAEIKGTNGIFIHRVGMPYNIRAMQKLINLNRIHHFDIIHAHGTCGITYPFFKPALRIPLVVHTHGTTLEMVRHKLRPNPKFSISAYSKSLLKENISILRQNMYWKRADRLIAVSNAAKREIVNLIHINSDRIDAIYNGVDPTIFKKTKNSMKFKKNLGLEDKKVILFVGHFGFRKGIIYIYEAMQKVIKEIPNSVLLCVGGTPKWLGTDLYWRALKDAISKYDLEGSVVLKGQIPHHKLPDYYSIGDVFAFPSLYEALGKVLIEAMACETPIVASNVGGIPEVVRHGHNGFLIQPKDSRKLGDYLIQILQNQDLASELGRNGRKIALEKFTWSQTAKNLMNSYSEVLGN